MLLLAIADNIGTITLDRDHGATPSAKRWSRIHRGAGILPLGGGALRGAAGEAGQQVWSAGHDIDELPAAGSTRWPGAIRCAS
jgi:hypothetical protein